MIHRKSASFIIIFTLVLGLLLTACGGGNNDQAENQGGNEPAADENKDVTITFGFTPWTTTFPGTYVAKQLIEDNFGHEVRLQDADVGVIYQGLGGGSIDVFMDNWHALHTEKVAKQGENVVDLGKIYGDAILGWGVPAYIDEGVQSIADLNEYKDLFDGKVTGIDPGAGMSETSQKVIEEYDLDYEYIASSEAAMLTALDKAVKKQEPLLFLIYRPHSMFANYDIRVLDDPKGIWSADEVHVVANSGLKDKAPKVYEMLQRFTMSIDDYEAWIAKQDEGAKPEDLAKEWIENNPDKVNEILGKS